MDPGVEPFDLDIMGGLLGGTHPCNRGPLTWGHRHRTTFPRDQPPVEITLKQRVSPPPHLPGRNSLLHQPPSLPAMRQPLILEHQLTDLRRREPCTDRQRPLPPLNASRLTHNQTGKEGSWRFSHHTWRLTDCEPCSQPNWRSSLRRAGDGYAQPNRQSCDAQMRRSWCSFIASLMKSIAPWIATWNHSMSNAPVLPRMSSTQ